MLLEARPSRRFTKLEKRSPAMAPPATNCADLPLQSEQHCRERRREQRKRDSANGLARPEQRSSVGQDRSAVERAVEARAERLLGEHGRAVGDDDQQDELGD